MKKIVVGFLLPLVTIGIVGCTTNTDTNNNTSNDISKSSIKKTSPEDFVALTEDYFEKQQALMMKQSEGQSDDFEVVSQHAKDVINSDEYQAWLSEGKKINEVQIDAAEADVEKFTELQTALREYNDIQAEYFTKLAEATDKEAYNQVNTDLADKLDASQNKFIDLINTINY